jgi:putative glutamine amidotransferase
MTLPIIGITANTIPADEKRSAQVTLSQSYIDAVRSAGGVPVILPPVLEGNDLQALLARFDGVLLSGGSDIDPARFDGIPHPRVYGIDPARDEMEIQLTRLAAGQGKPFLGICRGIQSINVALGGSLFTDIGDQLSGALKHDCYPDLPRDYLAHPVSVEEESKLAGIFGSRSLQVNSLHHQGVLKLAPVLRPTAYAPDGLIEAFELPDHPFGIAVQWHPECLQEHAQQRALFQAFIQAAAPR